MGLESCASKGVLHSVDSNVVLPASAGGSTESNIQGAAPPPVLENKKQATFTHAPPRRGYSLSTLPIPQQQQQQQQRGRASMGDSLSKKNAAPDSSHPPANSTLVGGLTPSASHGSATNQNPRSGRPTRFSGEKRGNSDTLPPPFSPLYTKRSLGVGAAFKKASYGSELGVSMSSEDMREGAAEGESMLTSPLVALHDGCVGFDASLVEMIEVVSC